MALREAARADPDCAALLTEITHPRPANVLTLAADLRSTGELRLGLSEQYVADVIWATAGFEHCAKLVTGREWTPEEFGCTCGTCGEVVPGRQRIAVHMCSQVPGANRSSCGIPAELPSGTRLT